MVEEGCDATYSAFGTRATSMQSTAPCHDDNWQRLLRGEEDMLKMPDVKDPKNKGDDWNLYYGWIKRRAGRVKADPITKKTYEWMFEPRIPQLYESYHFVDPNKMRENGYFGNKQMKVFDNTKYFTEAGAPIGDYKMYHGTVYKPSFSGSKLRMGKPVDIWRREHGLAYNDLS